MNEIDMELFLKIDDITEIADKICKRIKGRKERVRSFKVEFVDNDDILRDKRTFHAVISPSYFDLISELPAEGWEGIAVDVYDRYSIFLHRTEDYSAFKVLEQFREAKIYLWQAEGILENLKRLYDEVNKSRKGRPKNE